MSHASQAALIPPNHASVKELNLESSIGRKIWLSFITSLLTDTLYRGL